MANLPQSGIALVVEGLGAFLAGVGTANNAVSGLDGATGRAASSSTGAFGRIQGAATAMAPIVATAFAAAGLAVAGFAASSVGVAGDFEQTLNVLKVTSGATADEMAAVGEKAKALGADMGLPATSANDAADAMLELSRSGFTVQQAMDAARGALMLSAAAETDASTAAQVIAGALNAFGLEAGDAAHVTDLLAGAANASQASMTDLAAGLQQGGFAFNAAGQTVDDLATSLAVLTKNNLTGSDSGTALKNAMMRLMDPTEKASKLMASLGFSAYDTQGNMKPLPQIVGDLNQALAGMTQQERNAALGNIFLSDGMKAMIPLLDLGEEGFNNLKSQVTAQGQAAALAGAQMQGWNGAMESIGSQVETLQLTIGGLLLPILTPLATQVAVLISNFTTFIGTIAAAPDPIAALTAAFQSLDPGIQIALAALAAVAGAILVIGSPIAAAIAIIAGLYAAWSTNFAGIQDVTNTVMAAIQNVVGSVLAVVMAFWQENGASILAFVSTAWNQIQQIIAIVLQIISTVVSGVLNVIAGFINEHGAEILGFLTGAWNQIQLVIQTALNLIQGIVTTVLQLIQGDFSGAWDTIQKTAAQFVADLVKAIEGGAKLLSDAIDLGIAAIRDAWDWFKREAPGLGSSFIAGIIDGIGSAIGGLVDEAKKAAQAAIDAVKNTLGISSPSKIGIELGANYTGALATGMLDNAQMVTSAANAVAARMPAMPRQQPIMVQAPQTNTTTYQMPIYTNQSPAVLQQSLALVEAMTA